ncbi:MAG: DUF421 domain-containing protein [Clostridiales bacterium]|jgi:uncharacterized membrane protein YcaP (DUF421 family)|nr:DUF421 domain-containing protein [Clostridiales bacterium]
MIILHYLIIAGTSAAVYIFIMAAIRIFGKKEISQLSIVDLVFILLISNAVQNAMVGADSTLLGGLCAAATLFIVNNILKWLIYHFPRLSGIVQGEAIMLVYNGKVITENIKKAKISLREIDEAAREHGVRGLEDVDLAVLEVDGNISVLSNDFKTSSKIKKKTKKEDI